MRQRLLSIVDIKKDFLLISLSTKKANHLSNRQQDDFKWTFIFYNSQILPEPSSQNNSQKRYSQNNIQELLIEKTLLKKGLIHNTLISFNLEQNIEKFANIEKNRNQDNKSMQPDK